mmetsp:Transcript_14833/g.27447  ORF Transcript_14833/g.27447 Transcript_14833/m.27447 type:complete len:515 (-) Transcript_14833:22-1566(-)
MKQAESQFLSSLFQSDLATAFRQLRNGAVDLMAMRDSKNYTPLHLAALNNQSASVVFLLKYAADFCPEAQMIGWVNERSVEGFTCLHLASFRGNMVVLTQLVVKRLLEYGADMWAVSRQGLTVIHVAAQGDQPLVISFFQSQGLPIDDVDDRGGTPLHWATYLSSEQATNLLLAWKVNPDIQDSDLQTPLHLATLAGNSRIVRNLLLSGASRYLKDKEGRTPREIATQIGSSHIEDMLQSPGLCVEYGLRPPLRPYRTSRTILLFYLTFFSSIFAINKLWLAPKLPDSDFLSYLMIVYTCLCITSATTFFIVVSKDPGYLTQHPNAKILDLYENYDSFSVCPECVLVKPPRSRHCQCCNRCVAKFDHHCPWINNCVGGGNLGWFYLYVTSTWLSIVISTFIGSMLLFRDFEFGPWHIIIASIVLTEFAASLPLLALVIIQSRNFCTNRTTNERYSKIMSTYQPENRGCFNNFVTMCFNSSDLSEPERKVRPAFDEFSYQRIKLLDTSLSTSVST